MAQGARRPRVIDNLSYKKYLDYLASRHPLTVGGVTRERPRERPSDWDREDAAVPPIDLGEMLSPIREPRRLNQDLGDRLGMGVPKLVFNLLIINESRATKFDFAQIISLIYF